MRLGVFRRDVACYVSFGHEQNSRYRQRYCKQRLYDELSQMQILQIFAERASQIGAL